MRRYQLLIAGLLLSLPFVLNPGFETVEEILWIKAVASQGAFALLDWSPLHPGFYRPLSYLAAFVPFRIFGENPYLIHLCSALLNLLNASLFYQLLLSFRLPRATSILACVFFLLAPSVLPAISYPLVVHDQLCATFLLGFFLWIGNEHAYRKNARTHALTSALLLLGALLAKESWALALPLLLLYGGAVGKLNKDGLRTPGPWRTAVALSTVLALAYFPFRWAPLAAMSGNQFYETKLANLPLNLLHHYLFHFLPGLGIIYRMFMGTGGIAYTLSLLPVSLISFALLGILWKTSRRFFLLFGAYFAISLGPVLFLPGPSAHHAYLASMGLCTLLAWLFFTTEKTAKLVTGTAILLFLTHAAVLGIRKHDKAAYQNQFLATFGDRLKAMSWAEPLIVKLPLPDGADYMELNVVDLILRRRQDWGSLFGVNAQFTGDVYWQTFHWMDGREPPDGVRNVLLVDRAGNVREPIPNSGPER